MSVVLIMFNRMNINHACWYFIQLIVNIWSYLKYHFQDVHLIQLMYLFWIWVVKHSSGMEVVQVKKKNSK
ncbi:unnamed protein product [Trichobilharzia regenti]|nr:unnamed protein product [Trichobilharzia regenti]